MERLPHLDYCIVCEKIVHSLYRVRGKFYADTEECRKKWAAMTRTEQDEMIKKENDREK